MCAYERIKVLIETYWNVKILITGKAILKEHVLIETYWNVKVLLHSQTYRHLLVLIETYWNVKIEDGDVRMVSLNVLIETYWNVKLFQQIFHVCRWRINRNILECKEYLPSCQKALQICINRNILECKGRKNRIKSGFLKY